MSLSDEPLHHIQRTSLPWRDADRTVCGRPINQYRPELILSLADAHAMRRKYGQQRFALVICMVCANHGSSWTEWDANPSARMEREVVAWSRDDVIESELRAIAILIELHRAEFDELVAGYTSGNVETLAQLRARRAAKR